MCVYMDSFEPFNIVLNQFLITSAETLIPSYTALFLSLGETFVSWRGVPTSWSTADLPYDFVLAVTLMPSYIALFPSLWEILVSWRWVTHSLDNCWSSRQLCSCSDTDAVWRVIQKVQSLTQILDLLYTSYFCMGLSCTEILISFTCFIRSDSVLPQQKCSAMTLLSGWGLKLFEWPLFPWRNIVLQEC